LEIAEKQNPDEKEDAMIVLASVFCAVVTILSVPILSYHQPHQDSSDTKVVKNQTEKETVKL
jgi:hypothetical protein